MKRGVRLQRMEFFLLLSILLIIASIIITIFHLRQKRDATDWVIHTYNVIQIGNDVYEQLLEIENDRILFYVKGDTSARRYYYSARQKLQHDIEQLRTLVKLPEAVTIINQEIMPLIQERFNRDKADSASLRIRNRQSAFPYQADQNLMHKVQLAFQKLDALESATLAQRQADLDNIYTFSNVFLLISFGLIAMTTLIAWGGLRARQKEIGHLVESLREWNLLLENKVDDRTKKISSINQELLALNQEKDNFIGIVSHDLKSPITGIQNLTQLMKAQSKSAEHEYLDLILESCQHMQVLITEILDVNRIDQGLQTIAPKIVSVAELVGRLQKYYELIAREKQITLSIQLANPEIVCYTDESILYQVLSNLISNAIKFSKPASQVELIVSEKLPDILFTVKDFGPGIAPEEVPLLFKKFQKLRARPTHGESSTGLGLFIVNRLVQLLGGKVVVESIPNQQTSFTVSIPRQKETAA